YTSLHHIEDKNRAIWEMIRVMKDDGYLIIIELTEKGVELIRKRHINHPDAVNPIILTNDLNLKVSIKESRYLKAYIYKLNDQI
ncbi:MAG: class I SAM-dependent methyltransferase, partial [Candidatus Thorarchaeota archaeon]